MPRQILIEANSQLAATPVAGQPGRFLIKLIDVGWGSSGYYGADVLEAAAKAKVFAAGTRMYLDHPTESETYERPERTLRDLAGALKEDARWDAGLQALVAEAEVFSDFRPALAEKKDSLGVSIRAAAERLPGQGDFAVRPDGRPGYVVKELIEAISVDYVTTPGRGGEIMQVLESTRETTRTELAEQATAALTQLAESRNIGQWIESRLHLELTRIGDNMYGDGYLTREERIALSGAVGSALDAFTAALTDSAPQLFDRDLWDDPALLAAQVDEATRNVPVNPAGRTTTQEENMPEIAESELRELREAAGRVQTLQSERDAAVERATTAESERDEAREANTAHERTTTIERILTDAVEAAGGIQLNRFERAGVLGDAVITDDAVDEAATRTAFDTALAAIVESSGAGRPRGLGGPVGNTQEGESVSLEDIDTLSEATFGPISAIKEA